MEQTHVSWLMDSGMFSLGKKASPARWAEAIRQVQRMGYELYVSQAEIDHDGDRLSLTLTVTNRGVAPFYYDWPVELVISDSQDRVVSTTKTPWRLSRILPNSPAEWEADIKLPRTVAAPKVGIRVPNPMPGGKPLRFANQTQAASGVLAIH